ncbi:MAG: transcriptional regulator [Verrucomicrobiales bacterium]
MSLDRIDKLIHEPSRLGIVSLLAVRSRWSFQDLKSELAMSDGNLITHLRALYKAGYVSMTKEVQNRAQTFYSLTEAGRLAFEDYLRVLSELVEKHQKPD